MRSSMAPVWLEEVVVAIRGAPRYTGPERRRTKRWRPRPLRMLLSCLAIAAIGYTAAALSLISRETRLVFEAGAALGAERPPFAYEQIDLPRAGGTRQFAWVMTAGRTVDRPWVLYLHGNATTIASSVNISHYLQLRSLDLNVLAPEYRGFAGLDGVPTEPALAMDARTAYDYLRAARHVPPSRLVIYGWSLGGAVAVDLATGVEHAGLILEGAPASLVDLRQRDFPFFPMRWLMRNQFEAIRKIGSVRSPILFLHSREDAVIPVTEGQRLFAAAQGEKQFVEIHGGHASAIVLNAAEVTHAIATFLKRHGLQ
jgi:uncharacterized protein